MSSLSEGAVNFNEDPLQPPFPLLRIVFLLWNTLEIGAPFLGLLLLWNTLEIGAPFLGLLLPGCRLKVFHEVVERVDLVNPGFIVRADGGRTGHIDSHVMTSMTETAG